MYKKYQNARDASWQLLIDFNITELPIKVTLILKDLGVKINKYSESENFIKTQGIEELMLHSDGFTVNIKNTYYVFYDDNCTPQRCRFTLAHELGHIILNHVKSNECTKTNKEPSDLDSYEEQQANIFASRLLAPACVLHELNVTTAEQIVNLCEISYQSAEFRLERLKLLELRNDNFLFNKGYGCFYLSPLEKQVFKQFKEYIDKTNL